ncbi:hypothetical protein EVB81_254 [Rhizobium phage RHph_I46]|uniref:Uncharacterized protein n=1 Tax=Rhizobium phage RHph_I1_9 TaxID=2509729 RepID=A0A7S5UYA0_9CAUD|nr:hypothetical protein PP936_gp252 [Rhizobium phage RHph_I1_9]QIG69823.1 hypothetical protein EVB81_254 [Rhizobium phage RHph_I46]QIG71104.1 hypothetical protein EVB92_254 [Rhizobium phage RHph_I9]QIG73689.1 hypothetical protein EVC04_252 [Rhizobium phage RHph_I1_9]QIG76443.1 hypothetical protein EVC25_254 [Rhizobium phage RHph_I34]
MEKQLTFDLGDRHAYLDAIMEGKRISGSQSWRIYHSAVHQSFFLGIRTRGPVETDHEFVEKLSLNDALWLRDHRHVNSHVGVDEYLESMSKEAA